MAVVNIPDLSLGSCKVTVNDTPKEGESGRPLTKTIFDSQNCVKAIAIFRMEQFNYNTNKWEYIDGVQITTLTDYPNRGRGGIYDYNKDKLLAEHPTETEFKSMFYKAGAQGSSNTSSTYFRDDARGVGDRVGGYDSEIVIDTNVPIFISRDVPTEMTGLDAATNKMYTIKINVSADYTFDQWSVRAYPTGNRDFNANMLPSAEKPTPILHTFYINGGTLGGNDDYSITEVISEPDDSPIKWLTSEDSKYQVYNGNATHWETKQGAKTVSGTRLGIRSLVLSANGKSELDWAIANPLSINHKNCYVEHAPKYLEKDSGSIFTGNVYRIWFRDDLPDTADEVNNEWAHVTKISGDFENEVRVVYGEAPTRPTPDEQQYDDNHDNQNDNPDSDDDKPDSTQNKDGSLDGILGIGGLTKIYKVAADQMKLFGQALWSQSYENVLKIQDNPIENIISVKKFPFDIAGTTKTISVGNVTFNANGDLLDLGIHKIAFPEVIIGGRYKSFLDYDPYTKIQIVLPYCGTYDLPVNIVMGKKLIVEYFVDLCQGDCMAVIKLDGVPTFKYSGTMGVNVPLTQTDRVNAESKAAMQIGSSIVGGATALATGNVAGVVGSVETAINTGLSTYTSQHTASGTGGLNAADYQNIKIRYYRPVTSEGSNLTNATTFPNKYGHYIGKMCMKYLKIGDLSGFNVVGNIELNGITASNDIKDRLINKLKEGFFI